MKIKEEKHHETRIRFTYSVNSIFNREDAMRWGISASDKLPFMRKHIRVEDGESYHDGTISFCCERIEDANEFVSKYLDSEIYLIAVAGEYKGAYVTVQIHLNLLRIYIGAEATDFAQVKEIEQMLELI